MNRSEMAALSRRCHDAMPRLVQGMSDGQCRVVDLIHNAGLITYVAVGEHVMEDVEFDDFYPDLTDPATIGCLLQLVREAWDDPTAIVFPDFRGDKVKWFRMVRPDVEPVAWHAPAGSEIEALVIALEAAP